MSSAYHQDTPIPPVRPKGERLPAMNCADGRLDGSSGLKRMLFVSRMIWLWSTAFAANVILAGEKNLIITKWTRCVRIYIDIRPPIMSGGSTPWQAKCLWCVRIAPTIDEYGEGQLSVQNFDRLVVAGCRSSTDNLIWYSVLHIYCVAVLPLLLYFPRIGVVNRNPRKFRRPSRRSTGKLLDALGKASERFVHVLQCLGFCALRA